MSDGGRVHSESFRHTVRTSRTIPREMLNELPTVGSCFAGIGGFDLGLERAGWQTRWQIEIDEYRRGILARHWPDVRRYGDITKVAAGLLAGVDLICGGFPCQDLSVAGARAGLAGERSSLFFQLTRIIGVRRPRWVLCENVPGLLSSNNGRDFAIVLATLGDLGYWWSYRILDSQYFGVAQRRRRVYIVGHLGAPCPPEILFEPESGRRDSPPSREAGTEVAGTLGGGPGGRGWSDDLDRSGAFPIAPALRAKHDGSDRGGDVAYALRRDPGGVDQGHNTNYITARTVTPHEGSHHDESQETHVVAGTVTGAEAHNGNSRPIPDNYVVNGRQDPISVRDGSPALDRGRPQHAVAVRRLQAGANGLGVLEDGTTHALDSTGGDAVASPPSDSDRMRGATGLPDGLDPATADSRRYAAVGDAVTVPVIEWIGRRILAAHLRERTA